MFWEQGKGETAPLGITNIIYLITVAEELGTYFWFFFRTRKEHQKKTLETT